MSMTQHVRLAARRHSRASPEREKKKENVHAKECRRQFFFLLLVSHLCGPPRNGRTTISTPMLPITEEPSFCVPTAALIETARRSWDALFPGEEVPQFDTEEAFLAWANSAQRGSGHSPPPPVFLAEAAPQPAPRVGSGRGARSPNGARRQQSPASLPQPRGSAAAQPPDARATVRVEDASGMSWEHGSVARAVPRSAAHRLSAPPP